MLSIRGSSVQPPRSAGRASAARRVLAPLRAANGGIGEALNSVANAFVKIFSPPQDDVSFCRAATLAIALSAAVAQTC